LRRSQGLAGFWTKALGASEVEEQVMPGLTWTVLADPEGNLFCVGQGDH
jgi:hypothetical protein